MRSLLNPLEHPIFLTAPARLHAGSAWTEHVPFGMYLLALAQPRVLVELGTHVGVSYSAFCQAVVALKLPTRCHAIDTWQGDEHAGRYGQEVLNELRAHHDPRYGSFSRLTQTTFDEAVSSFADGSIDLLHIDGLHTYEAVRHDFDTWLPKVGARGLVLMHDINVRERGFGVWKVWEELCAKYPSFAFDHGHGLGILAVGPEIPEAVRPLFALDGAAAADFKSFFHTLGAALGLQVQHRELLATHHGLSQEATRLFEQHQESMKRAAEHRGQLEAHAAQLSNELTQRSALLESTQALLDAERLRAQRAEQQATADQRSLQHIRSSLSFRAVDSYWKLRERVLPPGTRRGKAYELGKKALKRRVNVAAPADAPAAPSEAPPADLNSQYALWLTRNRLEAAQLEQMRAGVESLRVRPLISIVTPVYNVEERWLRMAIDSVLAQVYPHWELLLVDDASPSPHIARVLREYAARDPRIRAIFQEKNRGIAATSDAGVQQAKGEFVALLDHDDELSPDALYEVVRLLEQKPELDFIYSDEDKLDLNGERVEPFFKPDWSPDLLMSMNYICHLTVLRKSVLERAGGFRPGYDGSQDYDLFLRATELTEHIAHVPKILYHWRKIPNSTADTADAKPYAHDAAKLALESALERRQRQGSVSMQTWGMFTVRYRVQGTPRISIIIPTKDRVDLLRTCVHSILSRSSYRNFELLIVDNNSTEKATFDYLETLQAPHQVLRYPHPFNWAAINNFAAKKATGDYLLFLNNDMEVINADWLEALLEHAQRPEVGAVGAQLLYPTNAIQHAGVVMGVGGVANHAFRLLPAQAPGYFGFAQVTRNYSAVTGACLMSRREVFEKVGGFDEKLRVAFNDIDYCLRLREQGHLVVYAPHSRLYHFESATRGSLHPPEDELYMRERWGKVIAGGDPYYNPNLTAAREDFGLRVE
jgi:O-antigen biosynthesis protein